MVSPYLIESFAYELRINCYKLQYTSEKHLIKGDGSILKFMLTKIVYNMYMILVHLVLHDVLGLQSVPDLSANNMKCIGLSFAFRDFGAWVSKYYAPLIVVNESVPG